MHRVGVLMAFEEKRSKAEGLAPDRNSRSQARFEQIAGTFAQLEKARLVAKLKAARDRKKAETGKCGGRKSYAEGQPEALALAKQLHAAGMSYRKISATLAEQGHFTSRGKPHVASAIQKMLTPD